MCLWSAGVRKRTCRSTAVASWNAPRIVCLDSTRLNLAHVEATVSGSGASFRVERERFERLECMQARDGYAAR